MDSLFNRYASTYRQELDRTVSFSGQDGEFFNLAKVDLLRDLFMQELGLVSGVRLLDVGCGTGTLHHGLSTAGVEVTGVDVASGPVEIARTTNPGARYAVFDGSNLPFDDASFDATLAVCVFHHVAQSNQAALADEMRRVTRDGGLVVIIEHNPRNPLTRLAVWRCPFDEDAVLLPSRRTRALLDARGRGSVVRNFLFFPFRHRFASAIERKLGWLGFGAQYCAYALKRNSGSR